MKNASIKSRPRTTATPSADTTQHDRTMQDIRQTLEPLVSQASAITRQLSRQALQSCHQVGRLVHAHKETIKSAQFLGRVARIDVWDYLARELDRDPRTLRDYEKFYNEFDNEQLNIVVNAGLNWTHIRTLLTLAGEERERHLQRAIESGCTSQDLLNEVLQTVGNRRPGTGRRAATPRGFAAGCTRTLSAAVKFKKALDVVLGDDFDVTTAVYDEPPDGITDATARQIGEAIASFETIRERLNESLPRLRAAAAHVDRLFGQRAKAAIRDDGAALVAAGTE